MLPFNSIGFFVIIFLIVLSAVVGKLFLKKQYYKHLLFVFNGFFLCFIYASPYHFLLLIVFAYITTILLLDVLKLQNKIWGVLLLILPLLLVKLDIRFEEPPHKLNAIISFVGLSYASFRMVSYYMDKMQGDKMANFISYFNYLSFIPTLLMGPIDRYSTFNANQENGFENISTNNFIIGWNAFVKGVVFKYIIAEVISRYWLNYYPSLTHSTELLHMTNTMYAYYAYLIFDFSGYSWMALGVGKMMGMNVPVNFRNPFIAINPQDYWKRFHITLGAWLKDYFFTPMYLYLSRKKKWKLGVLARQNTALMSTFLLMGCWNGLNLRFIISGFLFGVYSVIHNTYVFLCREKGRDILFGNLPPKVVWILSIIMMFHAAAFSIYIFSGYFPY